jgi:O-antigen ligase
MLTVILAAAAWFAARAARGERLLARTWSPLLIPVVVFVTATGLTLFGAFSVSAWLNEWLKWVVILALIVLALNLRRWDWLVAGVVLAAFANAVIGLYTFLGGSGALHLLINDRFFRAFGTFGQPNPFGAFMGLVAPLAVTSALGHGWLVIRRYRAQRRLDLTHAALALVYAGAAVLISLGVIISWSRGAWLGFVASLVVVLIVLPRRRWQNLALAALLIASGLFVWQSGLLPAAITERLVSATQDLFVLYDVRGVDITPANYAIVERLAHWQAALNMADAHPWLGVGFGNYENAYDAYRLLNWRESLGHAHNYYLNLLAETGIIGTSAYGMLWLWVLWTTLRALRHPDTFARLTAAGLLGTWTYLLLHSLTDNVYVNNMFLHLGIMLGILANVANQTRLNARTKTV